MWVRCDYKWNRDHFFHSIKDIWKVKDEIKEDIDAPDVYLTHCARLIPIGDDGNYTAELQEKPPKDQCCKGCLKMEKKCLGATAKKTKGVK